MILFANRASATLLASWDASVGGRLPAEWHQRIADALASGEGRRVLVPSGDRVLELDLVPVPAHNYVNVYGRDVTGQEAARQARETLLAELTGERARLAHLAEELQHERDLLQTLMENTRASLVYLDRDFNFVRMNAAYEAACQRPRAEMLGRNHFDLFPNAENEAIFRYVRDTGRAVEFRAKPFEFADQPWRGVTYWDWTLTPVKRDGGPVEGLVLSLVDVTERIRAEKLGEALNDIHTAISSRLDPAEIMQTLLTRAVGALGCDAGGIGLRENGAWVLRYGAGLREDALGVVLKDAEAPVSVRVAAERKPIAICEATEAAGANQALMAHFGIHAVLALPLVIRDEVIGILSFNYEHPRAAFSEAEMDFARKLAVSASLALENARLLDGESRQRTLAEQRAAELEAAMDAISDGVIIYDTEGKIVRLNAAAHQALGFPPGEEQAPLAQRRARLQAMLVDRPDARPDEMPALRALRGENVCGELMRVHRMDDPDGTFTYILVSAAPIREQQGTQLGAVISFSDVTELRRARDELEVRVRERTAELARANEALQYQANLLENVNDAILAYDANLRITAWNRAAEEQYGWKAEEVIGAPAPEVVGSRLSAHERDEIMRAVAETGRWQGEVRHTRRDGTPLVVEVTSMALRDGSGHVFAHVTVNRDITERKRAEEELRANREQLQNLSHRLVMLQESERSYVANQLYNDEGQRLSALLLKLGMMEKETNGDQALAASFAELKEMAAGVLADMHALAVNLRPASLDRLGLVAALRQYAEELGRQYGLAMQIEASGTKGMHLAPEVETTVYRIAQEALTNIVHHSRATGAGVIATRQEDHLIVIVEDNGDGFDVEKTIRDGRLGILGMRERAEMLGGCVSIESSPGMGTTVFIEVPVQARP